MCVHEPADCTDRNDCTEEGGCDPAVGCTDPTPVTDGTVCAGGTCQAGVCDLTGTVLPCTEQGIRNAIAAGGGPYTFDCDGPVVTEAEIVIDNDVILDGEGDLTVDGDESHRVFAVAEGVAAELRGLTVTKGKGAYDVVDRYKRGGGISNEGTLTLTDSTVSGNTAGIGGGIYNDGTITLSNTMVSSNTAKAGGGISNAGTLTLTDSTVSGNAAKVATGILNVFGTLTLTNSVVSGNTIEGTCGRSAFCGGGIWNDRGTLTMTNSTVSGNTGGDLFNLFEEAVATVVSSTLRNIVNLQGAVLTITNSLVAGGCSTPSAVTSDGHNIESPGDTCGFDQVTDQVDVAEGQLNLGPLQDNGGPTMTHALLPSSVAIDVIPADMCEVDEDQRGEPRDSMCDVGAFEVQEGGL